MAIKRISPEEANALVEDEGYVYLDVRSVPEFEAGHPSGAYNIPIAHMTPAGMQANPKFLAEVSAAFGKDAKLVLGCKSGSRSLHAAKALLQAGFEHVVDQRAGFGGARNAFGGLDEAGWQQAGLDVSIEAEPGRSYAELSGDDK